MNSREAAYDEEELVRRAIEESKEDTKSVIEETSSRRGGKRTRSDSEMYGTPSPCYCFGQGLKTFRIRTDNRFTEPNRLLNDNEPAHLRPCPSYPNKPRPSLSLSPRTKSRELQSLEIRRLEEL